MAGFDFLIPGDPGTRTGGYLFDGSIVRGMRELGWCVRVRTLAAGFPYPDQEALHHARSVLEQIPSGGLVLIDGLAMGAMPKVVASQSRRLRLVALVHHPLAEETGLTDGRARALRASERQALAAARLVVVTSRFTAAGVAEMGVPDRMIRVVEPGTDPAPLARGSRDRSLNLLCVATLTPRKGHRTLLNALAELEPLPWRLACVGSLEMDPPTVAVLRDQIRRLGLGRRVCLEGEVSQDRLETLYDGADLFVLATRHEGYGMALAEALARGLPIVSTRAGAVPHTVPDEAALLVRPGDTSALARALGRMISDRALRERLARGAREAGQRLTTWRNSCLLMEQALLGVP